MWPPKEPLVPEEASDRSPHYKVGLADRVEVTLCGRVSARLGCESGAKGPEKVPNRGAFWGLNLEKT